METNGILGWKGEPGVSPTITPTKVGSTTTLTIEDVEGTKTATILDGDTANIINSETLSDNTRETYSGAIVDSKLGTKADASTTYNKTEVEQMLEDINGKVLWVNQNMTSQFEAQTVELDLDDYDEVEIFFILNGYTTMDSCKLIKYKFGTYTWKTKTLWNGAMGVNINYNTSTNDSTMAAEGRNVEWVDNGIKFGAGYSVTHTINTSSGSSTAWGRTAPIECHPAFIVGRKRNIYDLTTFNQE